MPAALEAYDVWRLEIPLGRVVGDFSCQYESMSVVAVCLKTNQGNTGWGYGECAWKGRFDQAAWYVRRMVSLPVLRSEVDHIWTSQMKGRHPVEAWRRHRHHRSQLSYLGAALRMALWDLMAKEAELPLFQYLGGDTANERVPAYGSLLDYPLSDEQAVDLARGFVAQGFRSIKVKVGDPNLSRDVRRLRVVREAIGHEVEIAADANMAWTCDEAITRLRIFQQEGVAPAYIEDPLPLDDPSGYARLRQETEVAVIGNDYVCELAQVRAFLEASALDVLRISNHIDFGLSCADLASEFGVPISIGNSLFESNVHLAVAMPNVHRMEFSNLGWNRLIDSPVEFKDGFGFAPQRPGHGLAPNIELLTEFDCPEEEVITSQPTCSPV
jgi:L-alanine-DL-glutamate epimerase-like enolase superfamily enzyme